MIYQEDLPYIPKIVKTEQINTYCNNLLASHFNIKKT